MKIKKVCPFCGSEEITYVSQKDGFGVGKAVVGGALLGPVGLLAGGIGANHTEMKCGCTKCGQVFDTHLVITKQIPETPEEEFVVKKKEEEAKERGNNTLAIMGIVTGLVIILAVVAICAI
jgi:rRNA maturation endonuclease Nob1